MKMKCLLSLLFVCSATLSLQPSTAQEASARADQKPPIKIQEITPDLEARAKAIADAFRDKGMVDLTEKMGARVRSALGITDSEVTREKDPMEASMGAFRAILFASQSVPLQTLRAYAAQLEKANGVIVFRGIPGGISKILPIVELTQEIILKDPTCRREDCEVFDVGVMVDPLMFRANAIDRVPAVITVDHDPFAAYCERPDEETASSLGAVVTYGDSHLIGHLEELARLGDHRATALVSQLEMKGDEQ